MSKTPASRSPSFPALVQEFFAEYLINQRAMSPHTVASYRDTLMLFLDFAHTQLGKTSTQLALADIEPKVILAFLDHLEAERHNTVRSRNLRLTALRAFLNFAAHRDVESLHVIERALGVPMKRFERPMLGFLSEAQMQAVIGERGSTWTSQRDHLLLTMLYNTGARVSELIGIRVSDVVLEASPSVHLRGKGRKLRTVPLWNSTVIETRAWLRRNPVLKGNLPLLPNRFGRAMTRANVNQRLALAVDRATKVHPSLATRAISPHSIRHSTAMHMLQAGVAFNVIALWLGHESTNTTHRYVEADLTMKKKALDRLQEPQTKFERYRPPDALKQFLQGL